MTKKYNVMNRGEEPTLVYLVLAKCNLAGAVRWSIQTELSEKDKADEIDDNLQTHAVCGARGTSLQQRCYTDAGGSCAVQEPTSLKRVKNAKSQGKISRVQISVFAVLFCGALVSGMACIKVMQMKHKRNKTRQLLERGALRQRPNMPAAVYQNNSEHSSHFEEGGLQANGDSAAVSVTASRAQTVPY